MEVMEDSERARREGLKSVKWVDLVGELKLGGEFMGLLGNWKVLDSFGGRWWGSRWTE